LEGKEELLLGLKALQALGELEGKRDLSFLQLARGFLEEDQVAVRA